MILRARTVVTMDGPPIENGAVAIVDDRIVDVGTFAEVNARTSGEIVDLGERTLLPGLINAHCHLDYTCLRGKIAPQESFTDWIRAINAEKAKLSADDYVASIKAGFAEAIKFGTTTIANLTAFPELISRVTPPIRTWWVAELINFRQPAMAKDAVNRALDFLKGVRFGLAPHARYTASGSLYRSCQETRWEQFGLLTTHLAESREETLMFSEGRGALYEFMKELGRDMGDCGYKTPLAGFLQDVDVEEGWIIAHLNELAETDFELLHSIEPNFKVVHCPRSHSFFRHSPFQFHRLRDLGLNICLGTDSLASNDSLSLFAEMRAFLQKFPDVSPAEIVSMVTSKSALAIGKPHVLGLIRRNYLADLVAMPTSGGDIFDEIIAFEGEPWTMIGGNASEV